MMKSSVALMRGISEKKLYSIPEFFSIYA